MKKTFQAKLDKPAAPEIVTVDKPMPFAPNARTMVIPTPRTIMALLNQVPAGHIVLASELRRKLAADAGADVACPLTTGIFLNIVARATEEATATGTGETAPYWRVVKDDGSLNPKYPGAEAAHLAHLEAEGIPTRTTRTKTKAHVDAAPQWHFVG